MIRYGSNRYKRFFYQALLFSGLGWVCLQLMVYFLCRPQEWFWIYQTIRIKENIARNIPANKIVFVGGSATLFGVRTADIAKELNTPTINYGVHAALEIDYILERAKKILKPGDVVILPLEYNHLLYDGSLNEVRTKFVVLFDHHYYSSLSLLDKAKYLVQFSPLTIELSLRSFIRKLMNREESTLTYNVKTLNGHGDETNNIGNDIIKNKMKSIQPITIAKGNFKETAGLKILDNFNKWCIKNEIKFFITYAPTISFDIYHHNDYQKFFDNIQSYFKDHDIKTIGSPNDFFYQEDFFYDTQYHLNSEGMTYHTNKLLLTIKDLIQRQ